MNVLKPNLKATVITLLEKGISQREIKRKTGIDRKTIRRYEHLCRLGETEVNDHSKSPTLEGVATGSFAQNPPRRPPAIGDPLPTCSACEPYRKWIEEQLSLGRNAMSIYQDLVELFGFTHQYNSVKRFVRRLRKKDPHQYDRLEFPPGEEAQVDYGAGAPTLHNSGKYRKPRLFVMVLKYSGRAFRKVVWKSSSETWCKLHEEAFWYFGGCPQYVTLDNLKEGVIKADIYDPELNVLYAAMLSHYDVAADPARVKDPNRKGTVENGVKYTQNTALKGRKFQCIEAQNDWLMHWENRWAAPRIHGRAKRQVEKMFQEEKSFLLPLPLMPFAYCRQETRTVYDDGTIQLDSCYYAANPAPLNSKVVVRVYDKEIEILDPKRMEIIRRHLKGRRPGSLMMEPGERIFNPSRQTDQLLARAEAIGPNTFSLCETWFNEEGRSGQRRMYGLINLVRQYPARYVEKAAKIAKANDLKSSKALRSMVKRMADDERKTERLTQEHPLIRPGEDYAVFWDQHAAGGSSPQEPIASESKTRVQLPQIWEQASWHEVIKVFGLEVDPKRSRRDNEIWIKSPFTHEEKASMHVSLSENIFKDFSSGKGGGIMQFCREMLYQKGREMTMFEVARWMVSEGISSANHSAMVGQSKQITKTGTNPAIKIDLRRYLRTDHPELGRRGISNATCRYLGCGFLPQRSAKKGSPLNSRLVFQVRGIKENGHGPQPIIVSHTGRALSLEQENRIGKYWSYPFKKGFEIYNQDHILLDEEACRQTNMFGLILTEGFFDVAKLVEAGCRNAVALMGSTISVEQIERLLWIHTRVQFPRIVLFLDRDSAGKNATLQVREQLSRHGLSVSVFDWDQRVSFNGREPQHITESIKDPADMPVEQLRVLRSQGML